MALAAKLDAEQGEPRRIVADGVVDAADAALAVSGRPRGPGPDCSGRRQPHFDGLPLPQATAVPGGPGDRGPGGVLAADVWLSPRAGFVRSPPAPAGNVEPGCQPEEASRDESYMKDVDAKLAKILTDEQKTQLKEMRPGRGPGGPGGGPGGRGGPGGGPGDGPPPGRPGQDRDRPRSPIGNSPFLHLRPLRGSNRR